MLDACPMPRTLLGVLFVVGVGCGGESAERKGAPDAERADPPDAERSDSPDAERSDSPDAEHADSPDTAPAIPALERPRGATIAAGSAQTCAVVRVGDDPTTRVKCWGLNEDGELGLGDTKPRLSRRQMGRALPFVPIGTERSIASVAATNGNSCGIDEAGELWCWGGGVEHAEEPHPPTRMSIPGPAVKVAMGAMHACVLLTSGAVHCWGSGFDGQLGNGSKTSQALTPDAWPAVDFGRDLVVNDLVSGPTHSCASFTDGRVKCWGSGHDGLLGVDDLDDRGDEPGEMGDALPFVAFAPGFRARELSTGTGAHTCALADDRRVACWGGNRFGQLGLGNRRSPGLKPGQDPTPMRGPRPLVDVGSTGKVVALAVGNVHTCVVIERAPGDAGVKCWGGNMGGALGSTPLNPRGDGPDEMGEAMPFVELGTDLVPVALAAGANHSCAVLVERSELALPPARRNGRVKCWGGIDELEQPDPDREHMGDALPFIDLGPDVYVIVR